MSEFIYLQYEKKGKLVCITLGQRIPTRAES
jgi:hypothetical protein